MKLPRHAPIPAACLCLALLAGKAAPARGQAPPPSTDAASSPSSPSEGADGDQASSEAQAPPRGSGRFQRDPQTGDYGDPGSPPYFRNIGNGNYLLITPENPEGEVVEAADLEKKIQELSQPAGQPVAGPEDSGKCPADPSCWPGGVRPGSGPGRASAPPSASSRAPGGPPPGPPAQRDAPPSPPTREQVREQVAGQNQPGSGSAAGAGGYTTSDAPVGAGTASSSARQIPLSEAQQRQVVENYFQNRGKTPDLRSVGEKTPGAESVGEGAPKLGRRLEYYVARTAADSAASVSTNFDGSRAGMVEQSVSWHGTAFFNIPGLNGDSVPEPGPSHHL